MSSQGGSRSWARWWAAATAVVLTVWLTALTAGPASATGTPPATRYVATGGTDTGNTNCAVATPCLTISHAVSVANPGDTISVGPGGFSDAVAVDKDLTIEGTGVEPNPTVVTGDKSTASTFTIPAGITATLADLVIENPHNGGVSNSGTTTLTGATLEHNAEDGVFNPGTLTVADSTITANDVDGISSGGPATVTGSTITGNGLAGLVVSGNTSTVAATILSGNAGGNCRGAVADGGYNLAGDANCGFTPTDHDLASTSPALGAVGDNGGPTPTQAPTTGSPAVGVIPAGTTITIAGQPVPLCSGTDQRGVARPQPATTGACDIGAVELAPSATAVVAQPTAPTIGQPVTLTATVTSGLASPALPTPVGTLAFSDGSGPISGCTDVAIGTEGNGTCRTSDLPVGAGTVTAAATTTDGYLPSTGTLPLTVGQATQAITFTSSPPTDAEVGGPAYTVTATGGASNNPVTFHIDAAATSTCSIAGGSVTFAQAGTCLIDADQAGDADYLSAPQARQVIAVAAAQTTVTPPPPPPPLPPPADRTGGPHLAALPDGTGYWVVNPDGTIAAYGSAVSYGSMAGQVLNAPIVGIASTPDGHGYWLVASDGGVFAFGDARFYGSMGNKALNQPVVAIAATPDGDGYWLVASDGGVFTFGDATFSGSTGNRKLSQPIVDLAADPTGDGYWLVAADGGVFTFGSGTGFYGSMAATPLHRPIVGIVSTGDGSGYREVGGDGGVFAFGDATFHGSLAGTAASPPIVGLFTTADGGYTVVRADGTAIHFG